MATLKELIEELDKLRDTQTIYEKLIDYLEVDFKKNGSAAPNKVMIRSDQAKVSDRSIENVIVSLLAERNAVSSEITNIESSVLVTPQEKAK